MNPQKYLQEMKDFQDSLHNYLESDVSEEKRLEDIKNLIADQKICDDQHKFKSLLHLLLQISNNHNRKHKLMMKIEEIIRYIKTDINKFFTNSQIFTIFKSNKELLLFLLEEKILIFDEFIARRITTDKYIQQKYPQYFSPEIQPFTKENWFPKIDTAMTDSPESFNEKRKTGENDTSLCQKIQKDLISVFSEFNNEANKEIELSIYETNQFLLKKSKITLIEYAAFCGATNIIKFLLHKNIKMPQSIWEYAIHSNNIELIHLLENAFVRLDDELCFQCIIEAIKCHHNNLVDYFQTKYSKRISNVIKQFFDKKISEKNNHEFLRKCLKSYNFKYIENNSIDQFDILELCKYDYFYFLQDKLSKDENIDINQKINKKFNGIPNIF